LNGLVAEAGLARTVKTTAGAVETAIPTGTKSAIEEDESRAGQSALTERPQEHSGPSKSVQEALDQP